MTEQNHSPIADATKPSQPLRSRASGVSKDEADIGASWF